MHQPIPKPRVFVGSSSESLSYAYAVQENLEPHDAEVKVWPQGVFQIASYTLDSLFEALKSHDFGVFLFAANDLITIHDHTQPAVRDNVLFELGLFMGAIGRERTFVIAPTGVDLRMPSDLLGWNIAHYDPNREDQVAALGVACNKIRLAIRRLGARLPIAPDPAAAIPEIIQEPFPTAGGNVPASSSVISTERPPEEIIAIAPDPTTTTREIVSTPPPLESVPTFTVVAPPPLPAVPPHIIYIPQPPGIAVPDPDRPTHPSSDDSEDDWYEIQIDTIPDF